MKKRDAGLIELTLNKFVKSKNWDKGDKTGKVVTHSRSFDTGDELYAWAKEQRPDWAFELESRKK